MRKLAEIAAVIEHVAYWPGWEFDFYEDDWLGLMVHIVTAKPEREDPSRTTDLGFRSRVPVILIRSPEDLVLWLGWRIAEAEIHEVREGLRYEGRLVSDPHAPGG